MTYIKPCIYDNCKDCRANCEYAGKDREFICINGISCKVTYKPSDLEKLATDTVAAIKSLAEKPENLENLERYLSYHFPEWIHKYANTPENLTAELKEFANMKF